MRLPLLHALCVLILVVACTMPTLAIAVSNRDFMIENGPKSTKRSLFILSFPSGLDVHLLPENKLGQYFNETLAMAAEENYVGTTPLQLELESGLYKIAVGKDDRPMTCKPDGEDSTIAVLSEDGLQPTQKVYSFSKEATHAGILVALFWPKDQTLEEFVGALPSEELFVESGPTVDQFKDDFEEQKVPREDWEFLAKMFQKTGKLVWHGTEPGNYLISQWVGLEEHGKPKWLAKQPVLELK